MIPFFRKIRWRLALDNQFFKYSRYAIGEIVLVVLGILIALYINNWNEERKDNNKMKMYVKGLIADLEKDTISLNNFIKWSNTEIEQLKEISEYLNRPDSIITIDSIINYLPNINFINPGPAPFNKETFNTLVATGDVGLIPDKQMEELKQLNFYYKDFEDSSQGSMELIMETLMNYLNMYAYLASDEKNSLYI